MVSAESRLHMSLKDRMGASVGYDRMLDGARWAAENDIHFLDFKQDRRSLDPESYSDEEIDELRSICEEHDIHYGLHSNSAVNKAENMPFVGQGVDQYLRAHVDLAAHIGAEWVIVHPGYHFTSDEDERRQDSIDRLTRIAEYADSQGVPLHMCNMNPEPEGSEIDYLASRAEDAGYYAEHLPMDKIKFAFNAPHANLFGNEIDDFIDAIGAENMGHARLNDNRGGAEEHLIPGEGNIDFENLLGRLENEGFEGHYLLAFGSREDKLESREWLATLV